MYWEINFFSVIRKRPTASSLPVERKEESAWIARIKGTEWKGNG